MTAQQAQRLTDAELSERATWTRQQIEAIQPYYVRKLQDDRRILAAEWQRRNATATTSDGGVA